MVRWKREYVICIILTVSQCSLNCPSNVEEAVNSCMDGYDVHRRGLEHNGQRLYTGIDVETIRLLCSSLRTSYVCTSKIRSECPANKHASIDEVLRDFDDMAKLCANTHFIEVYARQQRCFSKLSSSSEECHRTFRNNVDPIMKDVISRDKVAKKHACSYLAGLLTCIKVSVLSHCGREAAQLVELLVRPEVPFSNQCQNETVYTSSPATTAESPKNTQSNAHYKVRDQSPYNNTVSSTTKSVTLVLSMALSTLVWIL